MTINGLTTSCFHAMLPDVVVLTGSSRIRVVIDLGGKEIFNEEMYAVGERVELLDMTMLVEPFLRTQLAARMTITATELDAQGASTGVTATAQTTVYYGNVDTDISCADFMAKRFLTLLEGAKRTAPGRLEYLHFSGSGSATVTARYGDGTSGTFTALQEGGNGTVTTINVSPSQYLKADTDLVSYVVAAGQRRQEFVIDFSMPDAAPVLLFTNSFGCQELIYCTGRHQVNGDYTRNSTLIGKRMRNYRIDETRKFKADTGVLDVAEQNWIDDLFRSMEIYVVNFYDGHPVVGKEVLILDSKTEFANDWDARNRATFTYTYAQRCHNIIQTGRTGRIFDNTFDNTFN